MLKRSFRLKPVNERKDYFEIIYGSVQKLAVSQPHRRYPVALLTTWMARFTDQIFHPLFL